MGMILFTGELDPIVAIAFVGYYLLVCVATLWEEIENGYLLMFEKGRNQRKFCRLYKKNIEHIRNYARFHQLWWNHGLKKPGRCPISHDVEMACEKFDKRYKALTGKK